MLCLLFLIVSFLQNGDAKHNISRKVLESFPLRFMGYISYACYILQRTLIEWWLPYVYFSIKNNKNEFRLPAGGIEWFLTCPLYVRVLAVSAVIMISWLVHRYLQDELVVYLHSKLLSSYRKICIHSSSTSSSVLL